jgi:hypothetical protein
MAAVAVEDRRPAAVEALRSLAPLLLALPAYGLVLFAHGFLPGMLPDAPWAYLSEGGIRCLNDLGLEALTSWCHRYGEPLGFPMLTTGPVLGMGAAFMALPGVGSYGAYILAGATFDALALAGGYGLMRRLGAQRLVALGAATVYLLTPTVIGLGSFGGTFTGFALLPAFAWCDLVAIDAVDRRRGRSLAALLACYLAVRTGSLFLDGYSFLASGLVGGFLWLAWLVRGDVSWRRRTFGAVAFLAANAIAVVVYQLYVPDAYEQNPIGIFRAMGADLVTILAPTEWVWPAAKLNYTAEHFDLWGDGSNSAFNYVGYACLILAAAYFLGRPRRREAVALAAAGVVALALSFGPSLKVDEVKPNLTSQPEFADYLMPEGTAAIDFPWGGVFTAIPGVDSSRATYRWFGVTRLALIVLAALAIAKLASSGGTRRLAAVGLAGLATVELLPNLPLLSQNYRAKHDDVAAVRDEVEPDLARATRDDEHAFFLSYDGSHNDYMVNFLASGAGIRSFSVGGDKNVVMAQKRWPPEVAALAAVPVAPETVIESLRSGTVDVVIAPFFHARWSSYSWPPPPETRSQAETNFAPLLDDRRLRVERYRWFATIRLPARG